MRVSPTLPARGHCWTEGGLHFSEVKRVVQSGIPVQRQEGEAKIEVELIIWYTQVDESSERTDVEIRQMEP